MKRGERKDERKDDFVEKWSENPLRHMICLKMFRKIPFGRKFPSKVQNLTATIDMIRIRFFCSRESIQNEFSTEQYSLSCSGFAHGPMASNHVGCGLE